MSYKKLQTGIYWILLICFLLATSASCAKKNDGGQNENDPCSNAIGNGNELIAGPAGPSGSDYDQVFRSLEVDPSDPDILYIGTERNGILKSTDGGASWKRLRNGIRHSTAGYPEVWDIAVSPSNPQVVIAATADSPGPVSGDYPSSVAGVYISTDGGDTWKRSDCGLTNSYALSVRFNPNNPDIIILGIGYGKATFSELSGQTFDGVLMHSDDKGTNWIAGTATAGAGENVFWIIRSYESGNAGFITFGLNMDDPAKNLGFLRSIDGGDTWNPIASLLRNRLITVFDVSADGQIIYAIERDAFKVLKSIDAGSSWNTLNVPANGPVKVSPVNSEIVIFCEGDKVYRSVNGLQSFDPVLTAIDRVDDIEFSHSEPNTVYLGTKGYHIYKSTDSGLTWSHLTDLRNAGILD